MERKRCITGGVVGYNTVNVSASVYTRFTKCTSVGKGTYNSPPTCLRLGTVPLLVIGQGWVIVSNPVRNRNSFYTSPVSPAAVLVHMIKAWV